MSFYLRNREKSEKFVKLSKKISESAFYFVQYFLLTVFSMIIISRRDLLPFNYNNLLSDKMTNTLTSSHQLYLMTELSIYISAAVFLILETRKSNSDFIILCVHHILTISLIVYGYIYHCYNQSVLLAGLHDISDVFLEISKVINYLGFSSVSTFTFLMFSIIFFVTRLYVFPKYLLVPYYNIDKYFPPETHTITNIDRIYIPNALTLLFILHVIWACFIVKMVVIMMKGKTKIRDIREKDE